MIIFLKIAIVILNIIYLLFKCLPTANKITMISRQSNRINTNFKLLKDEFEKNSNYKIVVLTKKLNPGIISKISYIFHMFKQMYHIATSKAVILDSYCITISNLKHKKKLLIVQMWHAMGSLKKFGFSTLDSNNSVSALKKVNQTQKKNIAKALNMHKNYDYFFSSSKECLPNFAEAFGYSIDKGKIFSLPIVDLLTNDKYIKEKQKEIFKTYPELNKKKNIVYVPTHRESESRANINMLINAVDYEKYNLIIKPHPLTNITNHDIKVLWDKSFSSQDMLLIADYIITDYSAIVYEASLLHKPIYFYSYDLEKYSKDTSFYIDYKKEIPGKVYKDAKKLVKDIEENNYNIDRVIEFEKRYITKSKSSTKDIVKFIKEEITKK